MKNSIIIILLTNILLVLGCTKEVEKIVYPKGTDSYTGSIVGVVLQKDSAAKVIVRQASPIDSTIINATDGSYRFDGLPVGNYDIQIKARNFRTARLQNIIVENGGVTYTGEISLSKTPDIVSTFYPEDASEIVFDRRGSQLSISISFTEAMDRESVEQAFATDPPSVGVYYWGIFSATPTPVYFWDDFTAAYDKGGNGAEITTFSKVKAFTYRMARKDCYTDTTYTVTLSTAAKDTAGNHLEFPLQFKFSTVQSATTQNVILTNPENGDIFVDPIANSSIYLTFPRRMNQSSVESYLSISPATDVIFVWPSGNELIAYTGGPLKCETDYQIHLDESALDLDGIPLGETFDFSFETAPVEVEYSRPQSGEIFVDRNTKISIQFNTYMILSSVQNAFEIQPNVSGSFVRGWGNNDNSKDVITFIPSVPLESNKKYTVTVNTNTNDLHGTHLKEPFMFSFVTEPE